LKLLTDLWRELHRLFRGATDEHERFRRRLATLILATALIDAIGTALMWMLEHDETRSDIHSVFESFFWVTTQLLTVSSQFPNPLTTGGRIVDIFLEVWAITVVATVAATFAAFLQKK